MDEFEQKVAVQVDQEMHSAPLTWWWLSFVDPDRPDGDKFLGACIVQGYGVVSASLQAHAEGCNPGGQVQGLPFPERVDASTWGNILLSREDTDRVDRWLMETYP